MLRTYDGRETAPAAARPDRFMRDGKPLPFPDAVVGGRSVGVPGVLRMLELAHKRHGRLPWSELFRPAISAAEDGFALSARLHRQLEREPYLRHPVFYRQGKAKPAGSRIFNPEYAATLRLVAARGADAFYTGEIAQDIVRA